ncbi:MAG TPA: hypothetical protein VNS79_03375 [Sphingobium sp.]|nr:hypothetical protein [Sphingobium sp.]
MILFFRARIIEEQRQLTPDQNPRMRHTYLETAQAVSLFRAFKLPQAPGNWNTSTRDYSHHKLQ